MAREAVNQRRWGFKGKKVVKEHLHNLRWVVGPY